MNDDLKNFMQWVESLNKGESEFLQAVEEVAEAVLPVSYTHLRAHET